MATPPNEIQRQAEEFLDSIPTILPKLESQEIVIELEKELWPLVVQYMVTKYVASDQKLHSYYLQLLDIFNDPEFNEMVLEETLRVIKLILGQDKKKTDQLELNKLKNLGKWLGMLTLNKDRSVGLDLKTLIAEAYSKGIQELEYVILFTVKVMEACAKSKTFKPPNTWTISIMSVLSELYHETGVTWKLKLPIELLCLKLKFDITELKNSTYLKEMRERRVQDQSALYGEPMEAD